PSNPKILLISEVKRTFAEIALKTRNEDDFVNQVNVKEFASINLNDYDIIINSSDDLSNNDLNRLEKYIEQGGASIFFANENIKKFEQFYNKIGLSNIETKDFKNKIKFDRVEKLHPIFSGVFQGDSDPKSIVESPEISKM